LVTKRSVSKIRPPPLNPRAVGDLDNLDAPHASDQPLPVGIFADEIPSYWRDRSKEEEREPPESAELAVAFIRFRADGASADEVQFLTPNVLHDLDVDIRVSRWPEGASVLRLYPVSIEPRSSYELSTFEFQRPPGDPPYHLSQKGRALLKVPQAVHASPYEFRYSAAFDIEATQPVIVVGQRNLWSRDVAR
jgi:hypothetical protein